MEEKTELKQQEKKAFWVGLGSIIAVIFLLIGFSVLIFGGNDKPKKAKTEKKQEEVVVPVAEPEPVKDEAKVKEPEPVAEPEAETAEPTAAGQEYEVQPGDTLSQIGIEFNVDWQDIMEANNLAEDDVLQPGDTIIIP